MLLVEKLTATVHQLMHEQEARMRELIHEGTISLKLPCYLKSVSDEKYALVIIG